MDRKGRQEYQPERGEVDQQGSEQTHAETLALLKGWRNEKDDDDDDDDDDK